MRNKPWISKRRRVRKKFQKQYPERSMAWIGGRLYFIDKLAPVPCANHVPKPGRETLGLLALGMRDVH
jgi:hypothetical protein